MELVELVAALTTFEVPLHLVLALRHRNLHSYQLEFAAALSQVDLYRPDELPQPFGQELAKDTMSPASCLGSPLGSLSAMFLLPWRSMAPG